MSPENTIGSNPEAVLQSSQGEWERLRDERNARVQEQLLKIDQASSQVQEMQANLKAHEDEVDRLLALPPGERKLQERMFLEESPKKLQVLQEQLNNAQVEARRIELASRAKVEDLQSDLDLIDERIHDNAMLVKAVGDNREIDHASRLVKDRQNSQRRAKEYQAELNDIPARMYDALVRAAEQMRGSGNTAEATRLQYALIKFPDYPYWQQLDMLKKYAPTEAATIGGEKDRAERLLQKATEENGFVKKELDQFQNEAGQQSIEVGTGTADVRQEAEMPIVTGLDAGGGFPLPEQAEGGDTIPLGDRTPEQVVAMDQQEAGEAAAQMVVPEIPSVPEPSNEPVDEGSNMDNEGRIENPIPVESTTPEENVGVGDKSEAQTTQSVTATPPASESNRYATEPIEAKFGIKVNSPGSEEAQKVADERDSANRYLNELGVHLGGLSGQLVRRELVSFLGKEGKEVTDEQINWVAQNTLDTATRLGLQKNGGESVADYFQRVADVAERSHMSLMDKIRERIPDFKITRPSFGASPEQKRVTIEARLKDINNQLESGDFAQAYDANGILRTLSAEERANARRKLEAERDDLQRQLDALPKAEGQGGGVETERRSWLKAGIELWRKFKEGQITRRTEKETARKLKEEATDELGRRLDQIGALNQRVAEFANSGELYVAGAIQALLNAYRIFFDVAGLDPEKRRAYADILGRSGDEIPVVVKTADGKGLELRRIDLSVDTNINEVRDALGVSLRSIRESSPLVPLKAGETRQMTRGQVDLQGVMASTASLEDRFGKEVTDILNAL